VIDLAPLSWHSNTKTTGRYDRRYADISVGDVERIPVDYRLHLWWLAVILIMLRNNRRAQRNVKNEECSSGLIEKKGPEKVLPVSL
jgi:hypothetical protein